MRFVEALRSRRRRARSNASTSASPARSPAARTRLRRPRRGAPPRRIPGMVARPPVRATPPPRPSRGQLMARRLGALAVLLAVARDRRLGRATLRDRRRRRSAKPRRPRTRRSASSFRRDSRASRWPSGSPRSTRSRARKRNVDPILSARGYLAATKRVRAPAEFAKDVPSGGGGGLPLPGAVRVHRADDIREQLGEDQLVAFRRNWKKVDLAYAKARNLTPYDVLIIASIIEREALAPSDQKLVAAVIYNRLHAAMTLGLDATVRYGLHIPPGKPLTDAQATAPTRTTRARTTVCRRRRSRTPASLRCRQPRIRRRRTTSTSSQARQGSPLLHREPRRVQRVQGRAPAE